MGEIRIITKLAQIQRLKLFCLCVYGKFKVKSKQGLYFVKENYEVFSTEVPAKEKTRTEQWRATSRSWEFHPPFGHVGFVHRLGST